MIGDKRMNIVFACGGTGGHINPAVAVAGYIKQKHPDVKISFIGNKNGMESTLVPKAGYDFYPIHVAGFQRQITPKNVARNVGAAVKAVTSGFEASSILKKLSPDIVIGMGGYVSGPVLRKAHKMGIKTATHEQNAFPGVTTKLLVKYVDLVMLAMPEAEKHLPKREYVVTGNPVRTSVLSADREYARKKLGMDNRPMVLSFGGSLGARCINDAVSHLIKAHCDEGKYYHYHAGGKRDYSWLEQRLSEMSIDTSKYSHLRVSEYIDDMDLCMAAADLVISRAGAITLSEIQARGIASILIPSPYVAENHQFHNAMTLKKKDAAIIIEEKDLNGEKLIKAVEEVLSSTQRVKEMGANARNGALVDANERIYNAVMTLINK